MAYSTVLVNNLRMLARSREKGRATCQLSYNKVIEMAQTLPRCAVVYGCILTAKDSCLFAHAGCAAPGLVHQDVCHEPSHPVQAHNLDAPKP